MMNKVKVVICGKEYIMQTAEAPNHVYGLARTLENKITESMDNLKVSQYTAAIMAALSALDDFSEANARLQEIMEEAKSYVDEAGRMRMERDAALKEIDALRTKIERLETTLKLKRLTGNSSNGQS